MLCACGEAAIPPPASIGATREVGTHDPAGERCVDVQAVRACYSPPHLAARVADPEPAPVDAQWRCDEDPRRCTLIARRAFACHEGECRQRYPRVPDDADWECADVHGLVVCRDRAGPSGAIAGPRQRGWICGEEGRRICIDLSPDRPGAGNYECRFAHEPVMERTCRANREATLGGPCRDECPQGMLCVEGTCIPGELGVPDCWTDADCSGPERCVFARCLDPAR